MSDRQKIFQQISEEREKQTIKWGDQHWPSFQVGLSLPELLAEHRIPDEDRAKKSCDGAFAAKEGSWTHILLEEFCEVVGTVEKSQDELEKELIQTAAVIVSWLEDLYASKRNGVSQC